MKQRESGSALVVAMMVAAVLIIGVGAALEYTRGTAVLVQRSNAEQQAVAAGNGGLDYAFVEWRHACIQNENLALPANAITLTARTFPEISSTCVQRGGFLVPDDQTPISVTLSALNATDPAMSPLEASAAPIPSQAQSATMPTYDYLAEADVTYTTISGTSTARVCRVFKKITTSPWQYAIFFNDDLELNPGSSFNVAGWVHTNGNLYTGGDGNGKNFLNFSQKVTYSGTWNSSGVFAPGDTNHIKAGAHPTWSISAPSGGAQQLPQNSAILSGTGISNNINTSGGYREVIERPVLASGTTDLLASTDSNQPSGRYYYQAGVKILVATDAVTPSNTTVTILNKNGVTVTGSSTGTDLALYNTFSKAITPNGSLKDGRENSTLVTTNLDINQIKGALTTSGSLAGLGANIIYISDVTANNSMDINGKATTPSTSGANRGIELVNGYCMPAGGLTIVSDNPVYILGDYNTKYSSGDIVPSNSTSNNDPTKPYGLNYTPQPCAVMADAVTVLSNSWIDTNSTKDLSGRIASNTTVNAAILSGIVSSGSGFIYTGGGENFPRLLEDWNKNSSIFTYYGSMVELFKSKQAIGVWKGSNVYYTAPTRHWYFDTRFYNNPPPGTFKVISYNKSRWFQK
jgi:hypothetical protein